MKLAHVIPLVLFIREWQTRV